MARLILMIFGTKIADTLVNSGGLNIWSMGDTQTYIHRHNKHIDSEHVFDHTRKIIWSLNYHSSGEWADFFSQWVNHLRSILLVILHNYINRINSNHLHFNTLLITVIILHIVCDLYLRVCVHTFNKFNFLFNSQNWFSPKCSFFAYYYVCS